MLPFRKELQTYSSICERLLSPVLEPALTQDEQDVVLYYANELAHKFEGLGKPVTPGRSAH
jgi:hypothetical protein